MAALRDILRENEAFLANIGRCITAWSFVEEKLFEICFATLKAPKRQAAIVYYRTPSIEARLALVDELVKAVLPPKESGEHSSPAEREWDRIVKEIRALLPERNALAHFPLKETFLPIESYEETANPGFMQPRKLEIKPHKYELLRKMRTFKSLGPDDLPKHQRRVNKVVIDLYEFQSLLRAELRG